MSASGVACGTPTRRVIQAIQQPPKPSEPAARSFTDLQRWVESGDKVYLSDRANLEFTGRLISLSSSALVLNVNGTPRTFFESDVRLIRQRRGDPVWNGLAIGAAVGFGFGLLMGIPSCDGVFGCTSPEGGYSWQGAMYGAAVLTPLFGGFGAGIDALKRRTQTVFLPPAVVNLQMIPGLKPTRRGIVVSLAVHRRER
jgi:hypothetical protein